MPDHYWTDTEIWQARYELACQGYAKGEHSRDYFKAVLYRLGFRGRAIESEVNLHSARSKTATLTEQPNGHLHQP